jgi:hypothetical protein
LDFGVVSPQADGSILLSSGDSARMLQGLDMLVQTFLIELCSQPTDQGGSGFVTTLQGLALGDPNAWQTMADRLRTAEGNMLAFQRDEKLADTERLRSLRLQDLREGNDGWEADILLQAVSGDTVTRTVA